MQKKLIFTIFLFFSLIGIFYPSKKEDTKLLDYCFSLEEIILRNSLQSKNKLPEKMTKISMDFAKFGTSKTRGKVVQKLINKYKDSKDLFFITLIPNQLYCFSGYWLERLKPGIFQSIFYKETKNKIDEFKDLKHDFGGFLKDIYSEQKSIQNKFDKLF